MDASDHHPQLPAGPRSVTPEGAAWLASASDFPRSVQALWADRPSAPSVLPCGRVFDAVSLSALFGRHVLRRLWLTGPGPGPAAVHRGRVLLLAAPGTAQRLPSLLTWEEWRPSVPSAPSVLCHGPGDAITIPPLTPPPATAPAPSRWLVAPSTRHPRLPTADTILRACLQAASADPDELPITDFVGADAGC